MSSSRPIICVPKRTHRVFSQNSPSLLQNSVRLSEFSSPKQYSQNSIPPVSQEPQAQLFADSALALDLRSEWPFTEWKTCPTQKSRENGKENGKWPQARNCQKMAAKMGKMGQNPILGSMSPFFTFFALFHIFQSFSPKTFPLKNKGLSSMRTKGKKR